MPSSDAVPFPGDLYKKTVFSSVDTIMSPNRTQRHAIARDTIARSESITAEYLQQGASLESTFIAKQFPALDPAACPYPNALPTSVDIVNSDSFALARKIMKEDPDAVGKTTVLNLASDIRIAGGWLHFMSMTQVSTFPKT